VSRRIELAEGAGILIWHRPGRCYASQGIHRASVAVEGDVVRDGALRRMAEARVIGALVKAKLTHMQLSRPPAPDSRPRRCHARPRGVELVCRVCRMKWSATGLTYPTCKEN
jgi:hypothetical protein